MNETVKTLASLNRLNAGYGIIGICLYLIFRSNSAPYFIAGWFFSVINLELLKRISMFFISLHPESDKSKTPKALLYGLLIVKFSIWGLVLLLFVTAKGFQGLPFLFGTLTILFSGLGLGVRDCFYART